MIITIDGPTASGKSTLARAVAKKLGIYYLATGMLYRALAYLLVHHASYTKNDLRHPKIQDIETFFDPERFVYTYDAAIGEKILFDGQDITPFLKDSAIDDASSLLSANKIVRDALLKLQRMYGNMFDLVAEGRDLGSVVFPHADFKFFLTASVYVRARRWQEDQEQKGESFTFEQSKEIISERDRRDRERKIAPLVKPNDAIEVDNSDLTFEETLEQVTSIVEKQTS